MVRGRANPLHTKFAERLRRARRDREMSASALAVAAGLGQSGVSALEGRIRRPRVTTIERLAAVLGVSPGWLAYGIEAPLVLTLGPMRCAELPERLREARTLRGLSLREVARRAGAGEGVAVAIERGTMPAIGTLEDLAKALQVSPAWLAFGEGPMDAPSRRGARPFPATPQPPP